MGARITCVRRMRPRSVSNRVLRTTRSEGGRPDWPLDRRMAGLTTIDSGGGGARAGRIDLGDFCAPATLALGLDLGTVLFAGEKGRLMEVLVVEGPSSSSQSSERALLCRGDEDETDMESYPSDRASVMRE
jgi:hypothetical protein